MSKATIAAETDMQKTMRINKENKAREAADRAKANELVKQSYRLNKK